MHYMDMNPKTKNPRCCSYFCCGNKFGVFGRGINNPGVKVKSRRYAKRAEKNKLRRYLLDEVE